LCLEEPKQHKTFGELKNLESKKVVKESTSFLPDVTISRERPRFNKAHFQDVQIYEGQTGHFEAKLQPVDDANLVVEWFHNNRPLLMGE